MHLAHRTETNGLMIAGKTLYPHCSDRSVLDISSERTIHCGLLKARYSNYLGRDETITHIFFLFLEAPFLITLSVKILACGPFLSLLVLSKCFQNFLAFPSVLIPSPIIILVFITLTGYFWQRKEIYSFPKMSRTFLGDTKAPVLNRLEATRGVQVNPGLLSL
jgi:hypothetical protein